MGMVVEDDNYFEQRRDLYCRRLQIVNTSQHNIFSVFFDGYAYSCDNDSNMWCVT